MTRRAIRERNILFLCMDNSYASPIAEAIANCLAPPGTKVFGAGLFPCQIHPAADRVMREVGIDISSHRPKGLDAVPMKEIHLVVALGLAKEQLPPLPAKVRVEYWPIPNTQQVSGGEAAIRAVFRYVRDEIDRKVAALFLDYWRNVA
jgi:arsenate reductase